MIWTIGVAREEWEKFYHANIASVLSKLGVRVILIDADFRGRQPPHFSRNFFHLPFPFPNFIKKRVSHLRRPSFHLSFPTSTLDRCTRPPDAAMRRVFRSENCSFDSKPGEWI